MMKGAWEMIQEMTELNHKLKKKKNRRGGRAAVAAALITPMSLLVVPLTHPRTRTNRDQVCRELSSILTYSVVVVGVSDYHQSLIK